MKWREAFCVHLVDEVEQALGLEIFTNIDAAVFRSLVPQAPWLKPPIFTPIPDTARVQLDDFYLDSKALGNPLGRSVGHGCDCRQGLEAARAVLSRLNGGETDTCEVDGG